MMFLPPPTDYEVIGHLTAFHGQFLVGIIDAEPEYAHAVHDHLHPDWEHEHSGTVIEDVQIRRGLV